MILFKENVSKQPLGIILLNSTCTIEKKDKITFNISGSHLGPLWSFQADTETECNEWCKQIQENIEKYQKDNLFEIVIFIS